MGYLSYGLFCVGDLGVLSAQPTARLGNSLVMIGVTAGIASTIGLQQQTPEVLVQMAAACGVGAALVLVWPCWAPLLLS